MGKRSLNIIQTDPRSVPPGPPVAFIEGRRLYLRGLEQRDINPTYVSWLNDGRVNGFMATRRFPSTLENLQANYQKTQDDVNGIYLAICLKEDGRHIGNVKLDKIDWISQVSEFGLLIGDPEFWGRGLGTEATYLITQHGFFQMNLRRITIYSVPDNAAAVRCYEKAGYQREGILRQAVFLDGAYRDVVVLGQLREEFRRRSEYEPG